MRTHAVLMVLPVALLLWACQVSPTEAAQEGAGLTASTNEAFDFRSNGSALPMYGIFVPCLVLFIFGVYRHLRSLGLKVGRPASRSVLRGLVRLFRFGLLQRRLLRGRDSAWTHLPLSVGFLVLTLGSLAIMVDSYLLQSLGFRIPRGLGYKSFHLTLDLFGLALIAGVSVAIYRRVRVRPEQAQARRYVLLVLGVLLAMGVSGFVLEGLRIRFEGSPEPWSFAGNAVAALIAQASLTPASGLALYRILWWSHAVVAFGLIAAVPYSPLRHTLTSPLHILVASDRLSGKLTTPFRLVELVKSGRFDVRVGADVFEDFSWRERLALSACAGSGGCQDACPAHATGTPLSPMRLMEDLERKSTNGSAGLLDGSPSEDAIWSCTLCGACTQTCPVLVDPMRFVVQLRRGLVGNNRLGKQRTDLLSNLSFTGNPYGTNGSVKHDLAAALDIPTLAERPGIDVLYWVGCAATFDSRTRATATATVNILRRAGMRCAVLGPEEACCGDPVRRVGEEGLFQELAAKNLALFERYGVRRVVTHCAHCFNTFRNEYPEFGARFEVQHHTEVIHSLIETGKIRPTKKLPGPVTLHDSCYVGRFNDGFTNPRAILRSIPGAAPTEMERSGPDSFCCGAGGANYWYDVPRKEKASTSRLREAEGTGARLLVTECPFCLRMLEDSVNRPGNGARLRVCDIAEVVEESLAEEEA